MADEANGTEKPKRERRALAGMALEMDVMKKIGFQLDRLAGDSGAKQRIIKFVADYAAPKQVTVGPVPKSEDDLL